MKYFIAVLGLLTSFNLSAMNSCESAHGVDQNAQPARPLLRLCITPYKDLSDAMKSEEYLAGNLHLLVQNYLCAVNTRNAERVTPDDIRITAEYENVIGFWWSCIEDEIRHISKTRQSIKFLINLQLSLTPVPEPFRTQLPSGNLGAVNGSEVATAVPGNLQAPHGSIAHLNVTIYNNLSDAMNSEGGLACNLQAMISQYISETSVRNALAVNHADIMVIKEYDVAIDNWFGYIYRAINQISASRRGVRMCMSTQLNLAPIPEFFKLPNVTNVPNQQQVNVQNQFTRPGTQVQSTAMQMPSNLRHN